MRRQPQVAVRVASSSSPSLPHILTLILIWGGSILTLIPTLTSNILPHWRAGETDTTINQIVFAVVMASLPLVALRVSSPSLKTCCILLGAGLFIWSLYNALHMGGQAQATATISARAILAKAEDYRAQIVRLETQKAAIPKHDVTGEGSVTAAQNSLRLATEASDKECKTGRGPNCLQRETSAEALRKAAEKTAADNELTKRADKIEEDIAAERQKITDLGPLPIEIDHAAAMMGDIGNVDEKHVSKWIGFIYAFIVEGLAFVGPASVVSALSPKPVDKPSPLPQTLSTSLPPSLPKGDKSALPQGERRVGRVRKKEETGGLTAHVGAWREARTLPSPGESIQAVDAYQDYGAWCRTRRTSPLKEKAFFVAMKDDPTVKRIRRGGRFHYTGIALKRQPALQVVSG